MNCERCTQPASVHSVSWFNTQDICLDCQNEEEAHPDIAYAKDQENKAVLGGDNNFPGVGWPGVDGRLQRANAPPKRSTASSLNVNDPSSRVEPLVFDKIKEERQADHALVDLANNMIRRYIDRECQRLGVSPEDFCQRVLPGLRGTEIDKHRDFLAKKGIPFTY